MAALYNNIGNVYDRQGKYERALEMYQQALKILIKVSNGTDVATSKFNLASLLKNMGQANESKRWFAEAAAIFRRALGADHPHAQMAERNAAA